MLANMQVRKDAQNLFRRPFVQVVSILLIPIMQEIWARI